MPRHPPPSRVQRGARSDASRCALGAGAVVDGIGWLGRMGDFRRMWDHYEQRRIEGLYTLRDLDQFRSDLEAAARRARLLN